MKLQLNKHLILENFLTDFFKEKTTAFPATYKMHNSDRSNLSKYIINHPIIKNHYDTHYTMSQRPVDHTDLQIDTTHTPAYLNKYLLPRLSHQIGREANVEDMKAFHSRFIPYHEDGQGDVRLFDTFTHKIVSTDHNSPGFVIKDFSEEKPGNEIRWHPEDKITRIIPVQERKELSEIQ